MLYQKELLPGVRLTAIRSNKFKTSCLSLSLLRPLRAEEAGMNALIPSVLLRGCRQYPDLRRISLFLENAYGAAVGNIARKRGETQAIGLYADFIDDGIVGEPMFRTMTDLVGQLLFEPVTVHGGFAPEAFAGERENQRNAIESVLNDKRAYAVRRLLACMCENEPYAIPTLGQAEDLDRMDPVGLLAHYQQILQKAPITVFYMGGTDPEEAGQRLAELLSPLRRTDLELPPDAVTRVPGPVRYVVEEQELAQSKLAIGFRMCRPETLAQRAAAQLFLTVFGGGSSSKLFTHVREEQSLCYYASATFDRAKGTMVVSSGIDRENYEKTLEQIRLQLQDCAEGRITEEELTLARTQLLSQLRGAMDDPGRLEEFYTLQAGAGQLITVEALLDAIAAVTLDQVVEIAASVREDTVFFLKGVQP